MSNNENFKIKINNWEKYQGRKDIKFPNWFAFSNRFFDDPDFYDFNSEEIVCFLFILAQCSLMGKGEISVNFKVFCLRSRIKESVFKNSFLKLEKLGIISIVSDGECAIRTEPVDDPYVTRTEPVRDPCVTRTGSESSIIHHVLDKTRHNKTRQEHIVESSTSTTRSFSEKCIEHLNSVCGSKFKPESKSAQKLLKGLQKQGYTQEDICKVIDSRASHWLKDPKMQAYLRPSTLFGSKFDDYLGQADSHVSEEEKLRAAVKDIEEDMKNGSD